MKNLKVIYILMTVSSLCEVYGSSLNEDEDLNDWSNILWEEIFINDPINSSEPSDFQRYSITNDVTPIRKTNSAGLASLSHATHFSSTVRNHQTTMGTIQAQDTFYDAGISAHFNEMSKEERGYLAQAEAKTRSNALLPLGSTEALTRQTDRNNLWVDRYGVAVKIPPNQGSHTVKSDGIGFLLGYDRFMSAGMVTGAVGYAYYKMKEGHDAGKGHTNIISAMAQGTSYLRPSIFLEYSILGAVNLNQFNRNIDTVGSIQVASSNFTSYTLDPHLGIGYDWQAKDWLIIEPFLGMDSVFNFQESYVEHGDPELEIRHESTLNSGVFRLECGLHAFQYWRGSKGELILTEKLSYVRDQPEFGTSNEFFVEDFGGFIANTGLITKNLAAFSLELFGRTKSGFFSSILYQGEMGGGVVVNDLHLRLGCFF